MTIDVSMEPSPAVRILDENATTALYADPFGDNVLLTLENTVESTVLGQIILTVGEIDALNHILAELRELDLISDDAPEYSANVEHGCEFCAIEAELPTEPGAYLDKDGDAWILSGDGQWYDHSGDTEPAEMNYLLAGAAPFTRVPSASEARRL